MSGTVHDSPDSRTKVQMYGYGEALGPTAWANALGKEAEKVCVGLSHLR